MTGRKKLNTVEVYKSIQIKHEATKIDHHSLKIEVRILNDGQTTRCGVKGADLLDETKKI